MASRRTSAQSRSLRPAASRDLQLRPAVSVPVLSKTTVSMRLRSRTTAGVLQVETASSEHAHRGAERDRCGERERAGTRDNQHGRRDAGALATSGHQAIAPIAARPIAATVNHRANATPASVEPAVLRAGRRPGWSTSSPAGSRMLHAGHTAASPDAARPPARTLSPGRTRDGGSSPVMKRSRRRRPRRAAGIGRHDLVSPQDDTIAWLQSRHWNDFADRPLARHAPTAEGTTGTCGRTRCDRRPSAETAGRATGRRRVRRTNP